jgi:hypothetical protein
MRPPIARLAPSLEVVFVVIDAIPTVKFSNMETATQFLSLVKQLHRLILKCKIAKLFANNIPLDLSTKE